MEQSLRGLLAEHAPIEQVRDRVAKRPGADGGIWPKLAELGVAGILVPEEHGGAGLQMLDAAIAAESLAWAVTPAPFLGTSVMGAVALASGGSADQQARWLPRIATGDCRIGVATIG